KAGDASESYKLTKFDQRGEFFRQLKSNGLDHLAVVLTGWPRLGYDRQHPDVLPPAPEAGGYEGMKRLADTCRELGYLFTLHDQYRDYYVDAPSYRPEFAVHEEDATSPPSLFPGTRPDGSYLDVFGYVPPDQDFNPEHPTTHTEAKREIAAAFRWARAQLGVVGTEAGVDW